MQNCRFIRIVSIFVFALGALGWAAAQAAPASTVLSADPTFTITTPTTTWTDTNLDLLTGDVLQVSTSGTDCGTQSSAAGSGAASLPLASAPAGALIARLHSQGALPMLVENGKNISIEEPSHLSLSVNGGNCVGTFQVKVHIAHAGESAQNSSQPKDIKSKLAAAAQTWLGGQFGGGTSSTPASSSSGMLPATSTSSSLASLKISDAALDSSLRKDIDGLPRRVHDQFNNLGDMVNFVFIGSEKQVQAALDAASWHEADTDDKKAVLNAVMETYDKQDYVAMPMSTLYLFDRKQDFGYEEADPYAVVASRHHFRIWKAPFQWNGKDVWAGAGTHDIGFAKDKRNGSVTHKIDPAVDGERDNIGSTLQQSGKTKTLSYYVPAGAVQTAKNATGDEYHSDGRILVVVLQ